MHNAHGLDFDALVKLRQDGRSVVEYENGQSMDNEAVVDVACDIWIPAARPDVIHEDNVHRLNTRLVIVVA